MHGTYIYSIRKHESQMLHAAGIFAYKTGP